MNKFKIFPMLLIICLLLSAAAPCAFALDDPELNGKAAILVDLDSGKILYAENQDAQRAPASLTKVMTVLLALEALDSGRCTMEDMVTAQEDCRDGMGEDSSSSGIVPGTVISIKDLLYCALLQSANESCNILGRYLGGSISGFVDQMNQKAAELGCTNTHFVNTNGLPAENHYSSAYDQYLIFAEAMKYPLFMEISNTPSYTADCAAVNNGEPIGNSNALINITSIYSNGGRYLYDGASSGKTGYTSAAGYCLISTAERNSVRLLAVVMGCDGSLNANIEDYYNFIDSRTLYDWGFDNFAYRTLVGTGEVVSRVAVDLAEGDREAMLKPASEVKLLLPNELPDSAIRKEVTVYDQNLKAPLSAGSVLGELRVYADDELCATVKLVNSSDIELSRNAYLKQRIGEIFSKGWVIALIIVLLIFAGVYIVLVMRYRKLRRRHLEERRRAEQRRKAERERQQQRHPGGYDIVDPAERLDLGEDFDSFFDELDNK